MINRNIEKSLQLGCEPGASQRGLGWCFAKKGDVDRAADHFERFFAEEVG